MIVPSMFPFIFGYQNDMTAIITKQNAKDRAFVGGGGSSSGGSKVVAAEGEFDELVVNGLSINQFTNDVTNELTNHENRITVLENENNTIFEELDGLDDFVITADSLINDSMYIFFIRKYDSIATGISSWLLIVGKSLWN